MSSYKNLDGTTKPSFKIGPRGIELSTGAIVDSENNLKAIKTLMLSNNGTVLTDDNLGLIISREFCTKIDTTTNPNYYIFYIKRFDNTNRQWVEEQILLNKTPSGVGSGNVVGPDSSVVDNLAAFGDESGKKIKDSGFSVASEVNNDGSQIPTGAAIVSYIGAVTTPLSERLRGVITTTK